MVLLWRKILMPPASPQRKATIHAGFNHRHADQHQQGRHGQRRRYEPAPARPFHHPNMEHWHVCPFRQFNDDWLVAVQSRIIAFQPSPYVPGLYTNDRIDARGKILTAPEHNRANRILLERVASPGQSLFNYITEKTRKAGRGGESRARQNLLHFFSYGFRFLRLHGASILSCEIAVYCRTHAQPICSSLTVAISWQFGPNGTLLNCNITMAISKDLLEILVCPLCKATVEMKPDQSGLKCVQCHRVYPIRDDIPVMLVDEAKIEE